MNATQPVFNYELQVWVIDGIIQDCGHPQEGEMTIFGYPFEGCNCYGREHAGEVL